MGLFLIHLEPLTNMDNIYVVENIGERARTSAECEKEKQRPSIFFFPHPYPLPLAVNKFPTVFIFYHVRSMSFEEKIEGLRTGYVLSIVVTYSE